VCRPTGFSRTGKPDATRLVAAIDDPTGVSQSTTDVHTGASATSDNCAAIVRTLLGMSEDTRIVELTRAVSLERHGMARVGAWLAEHRAEVLAAVRACDRDGSRESGMRLAAAVWPAAGLVDDPRWWAELAEAGEGLAIEARDPAALVGLLHGGAATFAEHGDRLRAEERWVRALAILRRDGMRDLDRGDAVLSALGALYRDWGRLSKAMDAYLELVELRRDLGRPAATADALAEVGATMYAAGRLVSAADYFDRADETLTEAEPAGPAAVAAHARILVWCGRTRWERGEHGAARRWWSRALAMLVDVDEAAADRVRALLAAGPEGCPEFSYWAGRSNTSSS
jgi:tetratricopeptide (TPR) repeat protein